MARRVQNDSIDTRDWKVRADEQMALAEQMPAGAERDAAVAKAEQFRKAAELMAYLRPGTGEAKSSS